LHGAGTADACAIEGRRVARSIAQYVKNGKWPESRLEVQAEAPIKFISPNILTRITANSFQFQSRQFYNHAQLNISQGDQIMFSRDFSKVIVNDFMYFDGDWTRKVDFSGPPLKATLLPQ
jgi:hypothetical protein